MVYQCSACKENINKTVHDFSVGHFGKPLCMDCQKRKQGMYITGDNTFQGKGFYCSRCKVVIPFPRYAYTMNAYSVPLCKECEGQPKSTKSKTQVQNKCCDTKEKSKSQTSSGLNYEEMKRYQRQLRKKHFS